jgi:hypothetical protein
VNLRRVVLERVSNLSEDASEELERIIAEADATQPVKPDSDDVEVPAHTARKELRYQKDGQAVNEGLLRAMSAFDEKELIALLAECQRLNMTPLYNPMVQEGQSVLTKIQDTRRLLSRAIDKCEEKLLMDAIDSARSLGFDSPDVETGCSLLSGLCNLQEAIEGTSLSQINQAIKQANTLKMGSNDTLVNAEKRRAQIIECLAQAENATKFLRASGEGSGSTPIHHQKQMEVLKLADGIDGLVGEAPVEIVRSNLELIKNENKWFSCSRMRWQLVDGITPR